MKASAYFTLREDVEESLVNLANVDSADDHIVVPRSALSFCSFLTPLPRLGVLTKKDPKEPQTTPKKPNRVHLSVRFSPCSVCRSILEDM